MEHVNDTRMVQNASTLLMTNHRSTPAFMVLTGLIRIETSLYFFLFAITTAVKYLITVELTVCTVAKVSRNALELISPNFEFKEL